MEETRVTKYKKYRQSLSKDNSPILETPKLSKKKDASDKALNTTSTLPIDQVINTLEEEKKQVVFLRRRQRRKIIIIALVSFGTLLVIGALIGFAIIAFH